MRTRRIVAGVLGVVALVAGLVGPVAAPAAAAVTGGDYVDLRVPTYLMGDPRWGHLEVGPTAGSGKTFAKCGCSVTVMASILNYEFGAPIGNVTAPHFPVTYSDNADEPTIRTDFAFVPPYVNAYLKGTNAFTKASSAPGCGNGFLPWSLERAGSPVAYFDGTGNFIAETASGITLSEVGLGNNDLGTPLWGVARLRRHGRQDRRQSQ